MLARAQDPGVRAKISAAAKTRVGARHPRWEPDREALKARRRAKWIVYGLIRHTLRRTSSKKESAAAALLGYTRDELVVHLERLFLPGMQWANYGPRGWHVDHCRPIYDFPLDASVAEINALANLRPLWALDNLRKGHRLPQLAESLR